MKHRMPLKAWVVALAWLLGQDIAHADQVLYDKAGFIQGQQSFSQSFDITTAGTLTITLTDIPWLDTISGLRGFVSNSQGVVGGMFAGGSETLDVTAGTVYAHWFGQADGTYGVGVYGIKVSFQPFGSAVVPIPGTLVLLLSALALLYAYGSPLRARGRLTLIPVRRAR
jgi:hypothetical protein